VIDRDHKGLTSLPLLEAFRHIQWSIQKCKTRKASQHQRKYFDSKVWFLFIEARSHLLNFLNLFRKKLKCSDFKTSGLGARRLVKT